MVMAAGEKASDEQVSDARPDVIVLAWAATGNKSDPEQSYKVTVWNDVPAIRNRRVHVIRDEYLNTPGPPLTRGANELFRVLHSAKPSKERRNNAEAECAEIAEKRKRD